ncbi:MAG TPA: c-type cytochrome [Vicinamibacterales bacterium]|nr:c-type cytochrome [Vicinamibacterales bacterium]
MRMRFDRWAVHAAGVALVTVIGFTVPHAQEKPTVKRVPAQPIASVEGVDSYREYCAVCHGSDARGSGPAARALKIPPSDLTRIAQRNGGKFPTEQVRGVILGDAQVPAHGERDMPIWGKVFRSFGGPDDQTHKLRVQNLVKYLESLQVK